MTPTKLLLGQILVVFGIIIAGIWFATQWAAWKLAWQPELGSPGSSSAIGRSIAPGRSSPGGIISTLMRRMSSSVPARSRAPAASSAARRRSSARCGRARQLRHVTTYGSARWASGKDIAQAGLLGDAGVFLGKSDGAYLRHDGPEHVMAFAPARSGKGVGLVVPTLLGWTGSAVVHDIKGENWQLTAGWRSKFSHCLLFNPTDPRSAKYNPLTEVRRGAQEVRDVQNIADILIDPDQIGRRRTEHLHAADSNKQHKLLLMLDEFPALGRLDFFETSLAFMAGYGIRAFLIAQSLNQIEKAYGNHNSILDNCHADGDVAGRAIARERFAAFVAQVSRQIASGRRTLGQEDKK